MKLQSYVYGEWVDGKGEGSELRNAVSGRPIAQVSSEGVNFSDVLSYARDKGGPALRAMTIHERAQALKVLGGLLLSKKDQFYEMSYWTGATKSDSWVDIEGGIGTMLSYSSLARRELANERFIIEGPATGLSPKGGFFGRHLLTPKLGVSIHINAFNFPCWGMLEKIAPSLIAGVPVVVKPASVSCYLTELMVREIIASGLLPEGSVQLICGRTGDLLDHLCEQDVVTFTGSASTGQMLCQHPAIIANSVPFNMEADSLNACILGESVSEKSPEFDLFIKEVSKEMTVKAGQKCTAIRRALVPRARLAAVAEALKTRLGKVAIGDPQAEGVRMGALVGLDQREDVRARVDELAAGCEVIYGGNQASCELIGASAEHGAFYPLTLLLCEQPTSVEAPHAVEAFGPVSTLMPYDSLDEAVDIVRMGRGSLVASLVSRDRDEAVRLVLDVAPHHGRILVLDSDCAAESTGHGTPLAPLVHGGPGRAGGGEELGGVRAITSYMQRTAVQGSPTLLMAVGKEYVSGAETTSTETHPFRKYFEDLAIGERLETHRRTVTEADIVNFGCISGDHFYAHFDELAAKDSLFGKRVAHGYFVLSAAAGLFVEPSPGPVLANYGLEHLRFVEPVGIGDTIQAKLTVKQKIKKARRPDEEKASGVVVWDVQVVNQNDELVALYDILTLVERRED